MAKRKEDAPIEPTLPITPMLDMTFQLFAFFVFTYSPQALEGKMDFSLPASGDFKAQSPDQVDPTKSDTEVALESDLTVEVRTVTDGVNKGNISQILIKSREGDTPVSNLEELARHLAKVRPGLLNQNEIKVTGESNLKWAFLVDVMDVCRNSGFKQVGFAAPPDLAASE
jgi:biopolymer transport protein ExbD